MIPYHRKNSLRLKGHDYSQPANYFVTICTKERACLFGEISNGTIHLSAIGEIVMGIHLAAASLRPFGNSCWKDIPDHFSNVVVDTFQIMSRLSEPNHVHGIVTIRNQSQSSLSVGVELEESSACSTPTIVRSKVGENN